MSLAADLVLPMACAPGQGKLRVSSVEGQSAVVNAQASNPLKFLLPQYQGTASWIYTTGFGGGMVSGDHIDIAIEIDDHARAFMGTQASTKIYKQLHEGLVARQDVNGQIGERAVLVSFPDPIACFAQADFAQEQNFYLNQDSSLFAIDWFSAGRANRGEHWSMQRLYSRMRLYRDSVLFYEDPVLLENTLNKYEIADRMFGMNIFGSVVMLGPAMRGLAEQVTERVASIPIEKYAPCLESVSPIADGVVWRFASQSIDAMQQAVLDLLDSCESVIGDKPWRRRP